MATRENQGLQAVIIVLTILTIILLVGLLLVNNARKTQLARADGAEEQRGQMQTQLANAQTESTTFKAFMGFPETDAQEAVSTAFETEMDRYGANMPADSRNYREILGNIYEENRKLVLNAAAATKELKDLKDRLLAVETEKDKQVQEFQKQMDQVRADMASERQKFTDEYARINAANEAVSKQMEELRAAHDEAMAKANTEKTQLDNQIATLETSIEKLRLGLPDVDQFAQPADGEITYVNQSLGTVNVNLGSDDGLRPQVTFSVASAGRDDAAQAEKKGSIEITQILGPHQARARITADEATDPLQRGDRIFSQVWDRGRQVGFGIAGFVDFNKDRKSDLELLKSVIAASGGVVDAAPDAAGKKQGELKVSTRYLVLGDYPNDARLGDLRESWNVLSEEAEALGIETIALDEFLSLMGWRSEARSVNMSATARAQDFPVQPREQELPRETGQPAGVFRKRLPTTPY
jgi:hypothetical protein